MSNVHSACAIVDKVSNVSIKARFIAELQKNKSDVKNPP